MNLINRIFCYSFILFVAASYKVSGQTFTEILGRPTGSSVTMTILFDQPTEVYWEYGASTGDFSFSTARFIAFADSALMADLTNLIPGIKCHYRTR